MVDPKAAHWAADVHDLLWSVVNGDAGSDHVAALRSLWDKPSWEKLRERLFPISLGAEPALLAMLLGHLICLPEPERRAEVWKIVCDERYADDRARIAAALREGIAALEKGVGDDMG